MKVMRTKLIKIKIYRKERSKKIMCLVLAALYNEGLIVAKDRPEEAYNLVEKSELEEGLVRDLGNHPILGRFQAHGILTYTLNGLKEKLREREFFGEDPRYLDIFDMHDDPRFVTDMDLQ